MVVIVGKVELCNVTYNGYLSTVNLIVIVCITAYCQSRCVAIGRPLAVHQWTAIARRGAEIGLVFKANHTVLLIIPTVIKIIKGTCFAQ